MKEVARIKNVPHITDHKEETGIEGKSSKQNKEMERTCPFNDIFLSH